MHGREREWLLREKYSGRETPEFFRDLERLARGEPLAYIIGWVDFLGCRIHLSSRPLIPRPETEWWTERVIECLRTREDAPRILDLFAGSGCIGIAILRHLPRVSVDFGEIDPAHCEVIRHNIRINGIDQKRTGIIVTDVFSSIQRKYDIIVANPPYIPLGSKTIVETCVLEYEPQKALFAKDSGMYFIKALFEHSGQFLNKDGKLILEFGKNQENIVARTATEAGWDTQIRNDQYGIPRWGIFTPKE